MDPQDEAELFAAVVEGVVSRHEADALLVEARALARRPTSLLLERGRLSADTVASLRAAARRGDDRRDVDTAGDDVDATGDTVREGEGQSAPGAAPWTRGASSSDGEPALVGWDRYQTVRFLGQGGMGRVFLARDRRLGRDVALKFMRGDDADLARRFVVEARAQARVSHAHVGRVYEVGEFGGRVYIAMQYIDGTPLDALAGDLTIEQKALMIRGAALGLHEAHRAGILHRDVKPANILVERLDDGELHPYVMDFGLARAPHEHAPETDATATGTVLGTPHYMAPEQARGEVTRLDRRADVYGLGATLYRLLAGAPPISGSHPLLVLKQIEAVDPPPLRAHGVDVPKDLEAIVLRCLEKERGARYDSARALADDLDRFLAGEPVVARPIGAWARLRRRAARNRRFVATAFAALVLAVVALAWSVEARGEAAARERWARRFGERVERIESMARYSALAPLHDTRADQAAIRRQMAELAGEIGAAGASGAGAGEYALGRGYLALGDDEEASEHLAAAWQSGFREPRAAYALAIVTGHRYQRGLLEAERIRNKAQREAQKRDVEQRYRGPALAYLKESAGGEVPSPEYVAALIAFYEDRFDDALLHVDAIGEGLPWFYEAPALRGDILLARARLHRDRGERDAAAVDFAAARGAYEAASAVGRSAPAVYAALGELEYGVLVAALYADGEVDPPFARGVDAAERALRAMPDHYAALVLEARLHRSRAESTSDRAEELLRTAVAAARHALSLAPDRVEARLELSRDYRQWAEHRRSRSADPTAQLEEALAIVEGIDQGRRDFAFYFDVGLIFTIWADHQDSSGESSDDRRERATAAYLQAIALREGLAATWINLGTNYFARAASSRAKDPDGDLDRAAAAMDRARSIDPRHIVPYFYGGRIHDRRAARLRERGEDPRAELDAALALYRDGIAINPKMPQLHDGLGAALLYEARDAWDRGDPPDALLAAARAAFDRGLAVAPEHGLGHYNVGNVLLDGALYRRARGEDPRGAARDAIAALTRAIDRMPERAASWGALGGAHATLAAYEADQQRDPRSELDRAALAIDRALARNPRDASARRYRAEALATRARFLAARGEARAEDVRAASTAFEEALAIAPDDQNVPIAFARWCLAQAASESKAGRDPSASLTRGLAVTNRVLGLRPRWSEALAVRAALLLADAARRPDDARALGAHAADDLTQAFASNRRVERAHRDELALARRLALPSAGR